MKRIRGIIFLAMLAVVGTVGAASIPANRLPPAGHWNPGCIGTNGLTYRQAGTFVPPINLTNIINVTNAPYNAYGDGIHDDTTNIQAAIAAGNNSVIYLPPGTYKITGQLQLANPNWPWNWASKILRGAGPTNTFIQFYGATPIMASTTGPNEFRNLAQNAPPGATTLTVASWDSYYNTQDWGIIMESNSMVGPPWNAAASYMLYAKSQIVHIIARNPTAGTITIDPPLYQGFDTNATFGIFYGNVDCSVGLENLSVQNVGGQDVDNICFNGVFNSWIRNIASVNAYEWHIRLETCARCTVCDSYIHGYFPSSGVGGGNSDYGAGIYGQSSDNLVINNTFYYCRHAMIVEYGDTGNVFAYNFNQYPINEGQQATDYLMGDMIQHGSTQWNLWEGNVAADFRMDDVLCGSINNMAFRDNMTRVSVPATTVAQWGYDIQTSNYWVSVIGSVMNNVGYNPTWRVGAPDGNGDYPYPGPGNGASTFVVPSPGADPTPTLWVDGVVDLQSNVVTWATTNSAILPPASSLAQYPASLFLTSAPAFWTPGLPWPAIGPDVTGYTNVIPAQARFAILNSLSYLTTNSPPNTPAPPTLLKILN